jgi:hypothetical protein
VKSLLFFLVAGLIWGGLEHYFGFTLREWLVGLWLMLRQGWM